MNFLSAILLLLKISIFLNVLAIGLKTTFADATSLFRQPSALIRAFLSMNVVMPLIALALAVSINLHPAVRIALLALSVSPVPPLLPQKAMKQGGQEDYTIGLLITMALLSIVVIPAAMELFQMSFGVPLRMSAGAVTSLVMKTVLGPALLGILAHALFPMLTERIAKLVATLASLLLALGILPVLFVFSRTVVDLVGDGTLLVFAGFAVVGLLFGYSLGGPGLSRKRVLALATSSRHPGIAAAIAHTNFPNQKLAAPAIVLYLIVNTLLVSLISKKTQKKEPSTSDERPMAA